MLLKKDYNAIISKDFKMKNSEIQLPSNKVFGFFFSFIFFALASYLCWKSYFVFATIIITLSVCIVVVSITKSSILLPFNILWIRFGLIIGSIISPIILGVIFFFVFTPIAFMFRLFKRDELNLKIYKNKSSWKYKEEVIDKKSFFYQQF